MKKFLLRAFLLILLLQKLFGTSLAADSTPPTVTVSTDKIIYYKGQGVKITVQATDDKGGSGIFEIHVVIDGFEESIKTYSSPLSQTQTYTYTWATLSTSKG